MNKQMIEFRKKSFELDLNSKNYEVSLLKHKEMSYKIDTFDAIVGNSFEYQIKPESLLEKISEVIRLISHVTYIGQGRMARPASSKKSFNFFDLEKFKEMANSLRNMKFNTGNRSKQIEIAEEDEFGNPK